MPLKLCEECGLPLDICSALAMYRRAAMLFERGRADEAKECVLTAKDYEDKYAKKRPG